MQLKLFLHLSWPFELICNRVRTLDAYKKTRGKREALVNATLIYAKLGWLQISLLKYRSLPFQDY